MTSSEPNLLKSIERAVMPGSKKSASAQSKERDNSRLEDQNQNLLWL